MVRRAGKKAKQLTVGYVWKNKGDGWGISFQNSVTPAARPARLTTTVQLQKEEHCAHDTEQLEIGFAPCHLLLAGVPRKGRIEVLVAIVVFGSVARSERFSV